MRNTAPQPLAELVTTTVTGLGFELVGVEWHQRSRASGLLRVYIDAPGGVNVDHCALVSRQLSSVLDVADPITEAYDLEVSSPGLDRPLFTLEQFQRVVGSSVTVKTLEKIAGRRRHVGILRSVEGELIALEVSGELCELPFAVIDSARLKPDLP